MPKTISLKQLSQMKFELVEGINPDLAKCIGIPETAFDCIIYGASGNGKSSFTVTVLIALIEAMQCKAEVVVYEEGHGSTLQENFLGRHNTLEKLGNAIQFTDHYTYDELVKRMARKKSAKIWVIDSLQAACFTQKQCADLKRMFVTSRKKKIIIYISWSEGKVPQGSTAKAVEYYANIKLRVQDLIVYPKTRYERQGVGNKKFVIFEPGARERLGNEEFERIVYGKPLKKKATTKKKAAKAEPPAETPAEPVTKLVIAEEAEKPVFKQTLEEIEKAS